MSEIVKHSLASLDFRTNGSLFLTSARQTKNSAQSINRRPYKVLFSLAQTHFSK
jgi:hypothetical protein